MPHEDPINRSLSMKRARDRRAQKNLRDKRSAHIQSLQDQIKQLEDELRDARQVCQELRVENEMLQEYRQYSHSVFALNTPPKLSSPTPRLSKPESLSDSCSTRISLRYDLKRMHNEADILTMGSPPNWRTRPDLARACPDLPQPIELLYGSKTNFLADTMHRNFRSWPCRDPERLAATYLTYTLVKFILSPTEERYQGLCDFQKPVPEQQDNVHYFFIDFIMWPILRANLIRLQNKYDIVEVVGLLVCCMKLKWPWNEAIFEPDDDGRVRMKSIFLDTFSSLDNWSLTREFWDRYPMLVEGLDEKTALWDFSFAW
ncbi:hypothetical protein HJFPF1_08335 [Paramyrothecium foliicola]|nr:hypothetical protein HJFPF1_08335 [Paramyrothecium foliicola]